MEMSTKISHKYLSINYCKDEYIQKSARKLGGFINLRSSSGCTCKIEQNVL